MSNPSQDKKNLAFLAVLLIALFGGAVAPVTKIALQNIPPFSFIALRMFMALFFILPFFLKEKPKIDKKALAVVLVSLLSTANILLFTLGISRTTANIAQILYAAVPLLTAVLSYLILQEEMTKVKLFGVILGFLGTGLIILLPVIGASSAFSGSLTGNLLILVGVILFSLYTILSKGIQKTYSPIYLTTIFVLATALLAALFAAFELVSYPGWWLKMSTSSLIGVAYVGILGTALSYLLYQLAIKYGSPVIASTTLYLQPMATVIWAFILLGEKVTVLFLVGGFLALLGAWITSRAK